MQQLDARIGRIAAAWVERVCRRAGVVLLGAALLSVGLGLYAARSLGVNSDTAGIVSRDLEFRRLYDAFAEHFPILDEAMLVVVDAPSVPAARDAAQALAARLEQDESITSVYVPGGDPFFERHALLYLSPDELEQVADRLAEIQPLLAELARNGDLEGLSGALAEAMRSAPAELLASAPWPVVLERLAQAAEAFAAGDPRSISWEELLYASVLPPAEPRRVLIAQPVLDFDSLLPARRAIETVRREAEALGLADAGVRVRLTGNVVLNYEEMLVVSRQAAAAGLVSLVLVGGILGFTLRAPRLVIAIVATLVAGLLWTAAFAAATVHELNLISVAFAVLFIGLGVDFAIHLGMRYAELRRQGADHVAALRESAQSVAGSLVLCAATTAIGFYVFLPTDFRAVGELGLISGTGMFVSLFCTLTLLPALLTWARKPISAGERGWLRSLEGAVSGVSARHARGVRAGALVLGLAALVFLPSARFDPDVVDMRDPSTESVQTFKDLLRDSGTSPWNIDVVAEDLASASELAARLEALPEVDRTVTLLDYVPAEQDEKLGILSDVALFLPPPEAFGQTDPSDGSRLDSIRSFLAALEAPRLDALEPDLAAKAERLRRALDLLLARAEASGQPEASLAAFERELLGPLPEQLRALLNAVQPVPVALGDLPDELSDRMLDRDGRARIQVFPSQDLGRGDALGRFVDAVHGLAPEATGSAVSLLETGRTVVRSLREALAAAVVVIALLLLLLWRRVSDTLLVLAPLGLAAILTGAATVALGRDFNFANVVVLPLLLGIGVDSGIHLVHRHRHARPGDGDLLATSTAHAVLLSALTTIASFGTLTFSSHRGLSSLGQLLTLGILLTLLCNLLVLPALLRARPSH